MDDSKFSGEDDSFHLEDLEGLHRSRVRSSAQAARDASKHRLQPDIADPRHPAGAVDEAADEPLEHVGRRHIVRPELAALIVGAIFIVSALVKPWGGIVSVPSPSASARISPQPLVLGPGSSEPALPPYLDDLSRAWAGVDWNFLSVTDTHSGWGISTAAMVETAASTPPPIAHSPAILWTSVASSTPPTVIDVSPGTSVFAIAITWPQDLRVTAVYFEYLGNGFDPPNATSAGFQPYAQVTPLSADAVAAPLEQPTLGPPHSGQFWVPPAVKSPLTVNRSLASAWHLLPWSWPLGEFKVTITSQHRPTTVAVYLRQTPRIPAELSSAVTQ